MPSPSTWHTAPIHVSQVKFLDVDKEQNRLVISHRKAMVDATIKDLTVTPRVTHPTCHPPTLASTCQVRCALASHLGKLASTCQRFVEVSQWMRTASMHDGTDPAAALHSFDSELSALQEQVSNDDL